MVFKIKIRKDSSILCLFMRCGILGLGDDSRKNTLVNITANGDLNSLPLPFYHCCPSSGLDRQLAGIIGILSDIVYAEACEELIDFLLYMCAVAITLKERISWVIGD